MKCIFLTTPGEQILGFQMARELGYEIEIYPTTQDTSSLSDSQYAESARYINRSPESAERPHVRSLRASWIRALTDSRYAQQEDIIFCESDAVPLIPAKQMKSLIDQALAENPETDVVRPFHYCEFDVLPQTGSCPAQISFARMQRDPQKDVCNPHFWGTHALYVPSASRAKVASIFADYRLPVDVALNLANGQDLLQVLVSSSNLFVQQRHSPANKAPRIAGLLSSYKRFKDLQRQIWCMMDQDYADFHLFVAAKGICESDFHTLIEPQFRHFIEAGRLTIRVFPNRNQLSNLLDTVRDLNVQEFDLFAKLDDDDIYARDYISHVAEFHRFLPPGIGSYYTGCGGYLRSLRGFPTVVRGGFGLYGPTLVFPHHVLELLRRYEQNPADILPEFEVHEQSYLKSGFGLNEDALVDFVNRCKGAVNRAVYTDVSGHGLSLLICQDSPSVMRGSYLEPDLRYRMGATRLDERSNERVLYLHHPQWNGPVRVMGRKAERLDKPDEAEVLHLDENSITLKWKNWGQECYVRDSDGFYRLSQEKKF